MRRSIGLQPTVVVPVLVKAFGGAPPVLIFPRRSGVPGREVPTTLNRPSPHSRRRSGLYPRFIACQISRRFQPQGTLPGDSSGSRARRGKRQSKTQYSRYGREIVLPGRRPPGPPRMDESYEFGRTLSGRESHLLFLSCRSTSPGSIATSSKLRRRSSPTWLDLLRRSLGCRQWFGLADPRATKLPYLVSTHRPPDERPRHPRQGADAWEPAPRLRPYAEGEARQWPGRAGRL